MVSVSILVVKFKNKFITAGNENQPIHTIYSV